MIADVLAVLVSIALLSIACAMRPIHGRCPASWWVDGVRPSGEYRCAYSADDRDWPTIDAWPVEIESRIYCTGGARPIVVNARSVGCQR